MEINPNKINLSEEDIENWLFENPGEIFTYNQPIKGWLGRQVRLPSGVADLIGYIEWDHQGIITKSPVVIEVKNVGFTSEALTQVCRYAEDVIGALNGYYSSLFDYEFISENGLEEINVIKIVIAKGRPTTQIQYEAEALRVILISFDINYELSLSGRWVWENEARAKISEQIMELSLSGLFDPIKPIIKTPEHETTEDDNKKEPN